MNEYRNAGWKSKTIKAVLRKKLDGWIESIEDQSVKDLVAQNSMVTGGCIASMLLGEKVNDFDVYFTTEETAYAVAKYYVDRFPRSGGDDTLAVEHKDGRVRITTSNGYRGATVGAQKLQDPGDIEEAYETAEQHALEEEDKAEKKHRPVFISTNAITLSGKIQLILRFYGSPDEIHKNYDFVHCTNYWTSDGELTLRPEALEALLARELKYVGSKYPLCSIIRLRKFIKRGWMVNAGQILKMCLQLSELDLLNRDVLEDQLTGVDVAYFSRFMDAVKEVDPEKVNTAYLVEIVNRMF